MALAISTTTLVPVRYVLASDPAVGRVNDIDTLRRYYLTRDPGALTIPADASWVVARPMDRRAVALVEARAVVATDAERAPARAAVATDAERELVHAAVATDAERELVHAEAVIAACVESVSDLPHLTRGPDGYPVEGLWVAMQGYRDAALVVREMAWHIEAVSNLPKAPTPSSPSQPGEASASDRAGASTTAEGATAAAETGSATTTED